MLLTCFFSFYATLVIVYSLNNPSAAESLVDRVEEAIIKRLDFPESFEKYTSSKERKHPYYRIYVNHYIIFYVVIDDGVTVPIMEVRRILYNRKNIVSEL